MIIKNKLSEAAFPNVEIYTKPREEYLNDNFFGLIFAVLDATWLKRLKNAALVILAKMEIRRWLCGEQCVLLKAMWITIRIRIRIQCAMYIQPEKLIEIANIKFVIENGMKWCRLQKLFEMSKVNYEVIKLD